MTFLANLLWLIFAGFWQGLGWCLAGLLWCVTLVGIPIGRQCFKFAALSTLMNLVWLVVSGLWLAIGCVANGLALCVTIVGIPFGLQCFKMAKLALMPFGAEIIIR